MRYLILLTALSSICLSQSGSTRLINIDTSYFTATVHRSSSWDGYVASSRYDVDTVICIGDSSDWWGDNMMLSEHDWVYQEVKWSSLHCLVNHGPEGCPDDWYKGFRICKKCLRKEHVKEFRWSYKPKTEYQLLDEKIPK